jgi:hypothetical protein
MSEETILAKANKRIAIYLFLQLKLEAMHELAT